MIKPLLDSIVQPHTGGYLFTTTITDELLQYLKDEFNFEVALRLVRDLPQQLSIVKIANFQHRCKTLVLKLFTKLILNYITSLLTCKEFDPWLPLAFTYNEFGKPQLLVNNKLIQFNSSSSNDVLATVVIFNDNNGAVGIDLSHSRQNISETNCIDEFMPIFDEFELNYLQSIPDLKQRYLSFNHIWTLKEAFTKLLGSGLNIDLNQFYFVLQKPLNLLEPNINDDLVCQYSLQWDNCIEINVDKLILNKNPFLQRLHSRQFTCISSILQVNKDLPVIISIIHQEKDLNINHVNINMLKVFSTE